LSEADLDKAKARLKVIKDERRPRLGVHVHDDTGTKLSFTLRPQRCRGFWKSIHDL
jgi:hypothetical protein